MGEVTTIGLDLAKQVFHVHGADASGAALFSKRVSRAKLTGFFASQPRCIVAMEACGGSHYWARELERLGHEVRLIPPAYVKPSVKRQKNDAADSEAICEAAQRPSMRFVSLKSEEQRARSSRPALPYFAPAIFWSGSVRNSSMRCVAFSPSMAGSLPRGCFTWRA